MPICGVKFFHNLRRDSGPAIMRGPRRMRVRCRGFCRAPVVARWFSAHFPIWAGDLKVPERNEKQEE
jgi:hypothetical protein